MQWLNEGDENYSQGQSQDRSKASADRASNSNPFRTKMECNSLLSHFQADTHPTMSLTIAPMDILMMARHSTQIGKVSTTL